MTGTHALKSASSRHLLERVAVLVDTSAERDVVFALPELLAEEGVTVDDLVELARDDPALTARILKAVIGAKSLPMEAGAAAAAILRLPGGRAPGEPAGGCVILVVEDEQVLREVVARFLQSRGFVVHQAENGAEAMAILENTIPDLIISDIYMPLMNGFALMIEVKHRFPDLPMLMMTGYQSAAEVLQSCTYRNAAFLPKPFPYRNVTLLPKPFRLARLEDLVRSFLEVKK